MRQVRYMHVDSSHQPIHQSSEDLKILKNFLLSFLKAFESKSKRALNSFYKVFQETFRDISETP